MLGISYCDGTMIHYGVNWENLNFGVLVRKELPFGVRVFCRVEQFRVVDVGSPSGPGSSVVEPVAFFYYG